MSGIDSIIASRKSLIESFEGKLPPMKQEAEGGCGVAGLACTVPIRGRILLRSMEQMRNRGNGKGGGIALFGLAAEQLAVSPDILETAYILQIAYLDDSCRETVEDDHITPFFTIHSHYEVATIADYKAIGLDIQPPTIHRYFVNVKPEILSQFIKEAGIEEASRSEDEFMFQNTYKLNKRFYASLGQKQAFVASHGKNMLIFKLVGYAEDVIRYYKLEDVTALVWISHHRYPTKGIVFHPGGAHPFLGLHDALVHNGDFSNYHAVSEYLVQYNIFPLFLTDTEVAAYLFDLWGRVFQYPGEYLIEALAPTTERDFFMLDEKKQEMYRQIQLAHINASPDGPWFFIVGRSQVEQKRLQLFGITDTSMLRPQVFAVHRTFDGNQIALVASERQAIDAILFDLSTEDARFSSKADLYWNARGGSYTDGGAFIFDIDYSGTQNQLKVIDKFGKEVKLPDWEAVQGRSAADNWAMVENKFSGFVRREFLQTTTIREVVSRLIGNAQNGALSKMTTIELLTEALDSLHHTCYSRAGMVRALLENALCTVFRMFPSLTQSNGESPHAKISFEDRTALRRPLGAETALVMDVKDFPAEGSDSAAALIVNAYQLGWKHVYSFDWRGQRFGGSGLGPNSTGFRMDVYGNPGDYLASGIDGAEIFVHSAAQDQVANLMKSGKLVIYGDVGQAFMYGAKGGSVYVLGNAAGRPLINAVGRPRVVINGTCLDYLAESFMAGDPLGDPPGGFVILGGIGFNVTGRPEPLETPFAGGNLFSLASGGAVYARDPNSLLGTDQLHGGTFTTFSDKDAKVIMPLLQENARLFGFRLDRNLTTGTNPNPQSWNIQGIFRKMVPAISALQ